MALLLQTEVGINITLIIRKIKQFKRDTNEVQK